MDGAVLEGEGVGGACPLHALAAVCGGLCGFELEGHGDVATPSPGGGEAVQRLGKAVQGDQAALVVQRLAGQLGKAGMDPG